MEHDSIFSFAYLQYTYEVLGKDIVDAYVPLFCKCILGKRMDKVEIGQMKNAMQEIYGIANITHGAIHTICDRMSSSKYGILNKSNGEFHPLKDKLAEHQVSLRKDDRIVEDFNLLVNNISKYSTKLDCLVLVEYQQFTSIRLITQVKLLHHQMRHQNDIKSVIIALFGI